MNRATSKWLWGLLKKCKSSKLKSKVLLEDQWDAGRKLHQILAEWVVHASIRTMYDFHNSTDTLKFWTETWAFNKTFMFFIRFWWNLVHMGDYDLTKFHQNQMKNKKVLLIACFSVQKFKVSVESWKLYIVHHCVFTWNFLLQPRNKEGVSSQVDDDDNVGKKIHSVKKVGMQKHCMFYLFWGLLQLLRAGSNRLRWLT